MQFRILLTHAQLANVERHHLGKAHLVGEIEAHQFVVHLQRTLSGAEANHTSAALIHTLLNGFCNVERSIRCALARGGHNFGIHLFKASERSQFHLTLRAIVALRHLTDFQF